MKNRFILILSLVLMVTVSFSSCKRLPQDDIAGAPSQEDVKTEAPASTDIDAPKVKEQNKASANENDSAPENGAQHASPDTLGNDSNEENAVDRPQSGKIVCVEYAYIKPDELIEDADLIFIGEYTGASEQVIPDAGVVDVERYHEVYTDYALKPISIIKGNDADKIIIRQMGGIVGDTFYSDSGAVHFQEGKRYLIYARLGDPIVPDDNEHYRVITTNCFEIDDNGNVNFMGIREDDVPKLRAQYEQALAATVSDK